MRIHKEEQGNFIQTLSHSIAKDPASLENWRCLHIGHIGDISYEWYDSMLHSMKKLRTSLDCDVVHYANNDVLLIGNYLHAEALSDIADELLDAAAQQHGVSGEVVSYDLFRDHHFVQDFLKSRSITTNTLPQKNKLHHFGEVSSLIEVFNEAKKLRNARMPLHVMVVEDDPLTRRLVTNAFKENYALISAANAEEAVANYLLYAPDVVFLDIGLPDANGFDVLHQIIASDADAYVVMFSGNSYLDNVTTALANGASGFVAKPFNKDKMRHYIQDSAIHHHKNCA